MRTASNRRLALNKATRKSAFRQLAILIAVSLLAGCAGRSEEPAASPPTPVRAQSATIGPAAPAISTNGIVATRDEMRLSFKVTGVIRSIGVEEGRTVKAGEKLAEIELTEIDAQVEQARQLAVKARRDLERGERLYADQVISLEQLQDLRTQAAMQQAQLQAARFNRGHAVITAPRDGVVLRKLAEERELVQAGQPILILGARDRGYIVRAALADREIVQLKIGDPVEIRMDAYPGQAIPATLTQISSAADEPTGMFPIEVQFDSQPVSLVSGLVAKINLYPASSRANLLTYVPIAAIVEGDGDRASVFVVKEDRAQRRPVRIAFFAPTSVALAEGLEPGERVVTDGALYLEDGERVRLAATNSTSGAATGSR